MRDAIIGRRVEPSRVVVSLLLLYNVKCVIDGRRLRLSCVKGGSFFVVVILTCITAGLSER